MEDPIDQARAKIQRYWNVDGLREISIGMLFGLVAVCLWASDLSSLPKGWKKAFAAAQPILICCGGCLQAAVVKRLRERVTYPRAGFVERGKPTERHAMTSFVVGAIVLVVAVLAGWLFDAKAMPRISVLLSGTSLAVVLWYVAAIEGPGRFRPIAIVMAAAGATIAAADLPLSPGMMLLWTTGAAAFALSGGITLWRFLRV